MGKSKGSTVTNTGSDPRTQQYADQVWNAAQGAAATPMPGVDPMTTAAGAGFTGFANGGQLGLSALSGDPAAMSRFMSPYMGGVIDQLHKQYGLMRADATNSTNDQATQAGAFGGSRHGVAQGVALGQLGNAEGQQTAGLLDTGFNNAMGRAGSVANLGFGANSALAGLGEYQRNVAIQNDPAYRRFSLLGNAFNMMPHGTTSTTTQANGSNRLTGAMGGAIAGSSAFGPWGAALGGLAGLLG